jgi:hypothetical protein
MNIKYCFRHPKLLSSSQESVVDTRDQFGKPLPITYNCLYARQIKNILIFLYFLYYFNYFLLLFK